MSLTVDANVLVYASNSSDPVHSAAKELIEGLAAGPEILYLFWPATLGYLRVTTHPAIMPRPLGVGEAVANLSALLALPHVRTPGEAEGFWELYLSTGGSWSRANDVPDAHLASLMRQHGVARILTRDRGFRRYDGIEAIDPFA